MSQSNSIGFQITNRGLSYEIDDKLDKLFGKDITLNANQWQSVFNMISADQDENNVNKFTSEDKDVKDGGQYVVTAGSTYNIKKNVWNKILDFVKEVTGNELPSKEEHSDENVVTGDTKSKEAVSAILKDKVEVTDEMLEDIAKKYEAYKTTFPDITEEDLETKVLNYAKGLKFHVQECEFAKDSEVGNSNSEGTIIIDGVKEAIENDNQDAFNAAFQQKAKEYIALHDLNGDNKIDVDELIAIEEKERGQKLTEEDRKTTKDKAEKMIAFLNHDEDSATLDENEVSAYLWATAKINDTDDNKTANDITYDEWKTARSTMLIKFAYNISDQDESGINATIKIIKQNKYSYDELCNMKDFSSLKELNETQQEILKNGLELLKHYKFTEDDINDYSAMYRQLLENGYENLKN